MAGSHIGGKAVTSRRTKVKSGCATCRIRKIKCDEGKPSCRKCLSTGRVCDGYESVFRHHPGSTAHAVAPIGPNQIKHSSSPYSRADVKVNSSEIELLARQLSTKTLFDVKLDCDAEAKQLIIASFTNPQVKEAIQSLRAVRRHLEVEGDVAAALSTSSRDYEHGVTKYCKAMGGLANGLRLPNFESTASALLCCQVFMGIEQARANFVAMTQHIIRGLAIMCESRARPTLVGQSYRLIAPRYAHVPKLDIFVIKFFAAPCKIEDPTATEDADAALRAALRTASPEGNHLRKVAPNMRTELTRIAACTIELLSQAYDVVSVAGALSVLAERNALLAALDDWVRHADALAEKLENPRHESIAMGFLRLFQGILRVILLSAAEVYPGLHVVLTHEHNQIQRIAANIQEKVDVAYRSVPASAGEKNREAEILTPISNPPWQSFGSFST